MASKPTFQFRFSKTPKQINHLELFEAKAINIPGADPNKKSFQVQWLFEPDDPELKIIVDEATKILQMVAAERGTSLQGLRRGTDFHWPIMAGNDFIARTKDRAARRGKTYEDKWEGHCAGKVLLFTKAYEAYPPNLFVPVGGKFIHLADPTARAAQRHMFYRGMKALGLVVLSGFNTSEKSWGVTAFVNEVVSTGKGDRIGSTVSSATDYGAPDVEGNVTDFDPAAAKVVSLATGQPFDAY